MKIAICDDERIFQKQLKQELEKFYKDLDKKIETFDSGNQFLTVFAHVPLQFELIFMDIEMPGINGMDTARKIRQFNETVPIVFLTSFREFATEGYQVDAFRYLLKPLQVKELHQMLIQLEQSRQKNGKIIVNDAGNRIVLAYSEIIYIKSENVYIKLCTTRGSFLIREKLKEQLMQLPESTFFQIHRSYVVNLSHVVSFSERFVCMSDKTMLPLSRTKRSLFCEKFMNDMSGKV